jgi:flagellar biosynthesis/type III secretory pathway protein FliH
MEEKLASNAQYMRDYRSKLSDEKKQKMLEYQKMAMKKKREQERAEKLANGIAIKIGRPKKQSDMTTKELKDMIDKLRNTIESLESKVNPSKLSV